MSGPVFDSSVLARLASQARGHGDTSLVRELVSDALASIAHCSAELEAAASDRDLARVRSHAHRIKSVLRQVGAVQMGDETERVEELARAGDPSALAQTQVALALRGETEEALREHLGRLR